MLPLIMLDETDDPDQTMQLPIESNPATFSPKVMMSGLIIPKPSFTF